MMNVFFKILRVVLGGVFIFSGIVKLIDPKGTAIKLEEYFTAFAKLGEHYIGLWASNVLEYLSNYSLLFSVGLSSLEVVLGVAVLLWIRPKLILSTSVGLLIFFGFLTAYSAQCDPNNPLGVSCVTDCGCFGDFLKLKPIESFYKDQILLALALPLFIFSRKEVKSKLSKKDFWILGTASFSILFGIYNLINLPIIDFRPYKIGNNLLEKRTDGIPAKNVYILEKDGKQQKYEIYPEGDGFSYIGFEEIEPEVLPSISDFYLFSQDGDDVTEAELKKGCLFLIFKNLEELNEDELKLTLSFLNSNPNTTILTGSPMKEVRNALKFEGTIYNLDETVLKAIVRNYPSIMNIENGVVTEKRMLTH